MDGTIDSAFQKKKVLTGKEKVLIMKLFGNNIWKD